MIKIQSQVNVKTCLQLFAYTRSRTVLQSRRPD